MITTPELTEIENKIKKYEDGKIALKKQDVSKLYSDKNNLIKQLKTTCKHDNCEHYKSTWTDRGYGCDRHYSNHAIKCNDCEQHLMDGRDYDTMFNIMNPKVLTKGTFKELAKVWLNYFNDEDWKKHGVNIVRRRHETVEIV